MTDSTELNKRIYSPKHFDQQDKSCYDYGCTGDCLVARIYNGLDERRGWPVVLPSIRPRVRNKKTIWRKVWNWLSK